MAEFFAVKAIKPQKMKLDEVRKQLLNELRAEGRDVKKLYEPTVATWTGDKPKFEILIGLTGKEASVLVGPNGSEEALKKFKFLDEGTRIRWALMSSDWKSKTKPGKLRSGAGRGKVVVVGKKAMKRPRPGIQARNWTVTIQKQRRKPFTKRMIKAKNRGLANLYA